MGLMKIKKSKIIASVVGLGVLSLTAFYFNGTVNFSDDLNSNINDLDRDIISSGDNDGVEGIDGSTQMMGVDTNDTIYADHSDDEAPSELPPLDLQDLRSKRTEHQDSGESINTGLNFRPSERGYSVLVNGKEMNWHLQDGQGRLLKQRIPFSNSRLQNMGNIVSSEIGRRFSGPDEYVDYPVMGKDGVETTKRMKKSELIESLTLLEKMWEKNGGDDYGTIIDRNGDPMKVFSPDVEQELDNQRRIEFGDLQPFNEEVSSFRQDIQDFFINTARAADSYAIPFTIFDRTWGNTNLFGFQGKLTGSIGLWGNAEDGGTYLLSADVDLSAYIFGNRKNFMSGFAKATTNCDIPADTSSLRAQYNIKKWGNTINSLDDTSTGRCERFGFGGSFNEPHNGFNNIDFDGFEACLNFTVFAGLRVRGCAGVRGSSEFNFTASGNGAHNRTYINTKQVLPYYGRASLALSPAGFDLAELSMNIQGKLLDMEHTFDADIQALLGVDSSAQKANLIYQQKVLGGRIYLELRWFSVLSWGYKTWRKEIKSNGWVRDVSDTTNLLQSL